MFCTLNSEQPLVSTLSFPRNISRKHTERLVGNSLTNNSYYTLNQYPWPCSLATMAAISVELRYSQHHPPRLSLCRQLIVITSVRVLKEKSEKLVTVTIHFLSYSFLTIIFQSSSYCGPYAELRLAEACDLSLVCGELNIGEEPELYSQEVEVVLPIKKIINHPS